MPNDDDLHVRVLQCGDGVYGNDCREVFAAVYYLGFAALLRLNDWAALRAYTVSSSLPTYTVPPATAGPESIPPPVA